MDILNVILVGIALSMDAFAITLANCTTYKNLISKKEWSMPTFFALFQGVMPIIGYLLGNVLLKSLSQYTGYITTAIFFVLAVKIVIDLLKCKEEQRCCKTFTYSLVFIQALATSLDALFVGVTFVGIKIHYALLSSLIIACVTFLIITLALILGKKLGEVLGRYAEWAGAGLLFILAIKSLLETIL